MTALPIELQSPGGVDEVHDEGAPFGGVGSPRARVLAGPPESAGAESLASHLARLGPVPDDSRFAALVGVVAESGLGGRGGAGYPTAEKMAAAAASAGRRLVVVNASESEPASHKDRTLVRLRPHTVLDGAVLAAEAIGADEAVVQLHRSDRAGLVAVQQALAERAAAALDTVAVRVSLGPDRFVAGESSAVVSFLEGGPARPRPGPPAAVCGVHGRPTLVQNAETMAHVAAIARHGAPWFRQVGTQGAPGSFLVTLNGDVAAPGSVFEVWGTTTIGRLLSHLAPGSWGGTAAPGAAVLVGGYGGTWLDMERAWSIPLWRDEASRAGVPLGCGLLGVLGPESCGVAQTAAILGYLAGESAGQCGPCAFGLPELASLMKALAAGRMSRAGRRRLPILAEAVFGRGGCSHPDGAVAMLESALVTFGEDVRLHLRHRPCERSRRTPSLPLPASPVGWR